MKNRNTYKQGQLPEGKYTEMTIPKKNGKVRKIVAPDASLLSYQQKKLKELETLYFSNIKGTSIADTAHGFLPGRNCVTAAHHHKGYELTIVMDISNFFDSVTKGMISYYDESVSDDGSLFHEQGYAAQGFATSPILANIAAIPMLKQIDFMLSNNFKDYGFTIYADDIQISFNRSKRVKDSYKQINRVIGEVQTILEKNDFELNKRKTRVRYAKYGYRFSPKDKKDRTK